MYRAVRNNLLRGGTDHAPGQIGRTAESLLIDKIAPAADSLPNQETQRGNIENRTNLHLADFGGNRTCRQSGNDTAVNTESSLMDIQDLERIVAVCIAWIKNDIVQTGANHTKK